MQDMGELLGISSVIYWTDANEKWHRFLFFGQACCPRHISVIAENAFTLSFTKRLEKFDPVHGRRSSERNSQLCANGSQVRQRALTAQFHQGKGY